MHAVIIARRERPITRPGKVEKVLDKFKIGPASYAAPGQIGSMSTFNWRQNDSGSQIELEIVVLHTMTRKRRLSFPSCARAALSR
jgi:hypothetical protein